MRCGVKSKMRYFNDELNSRRTGSCASRVKRRIRLVLRLSYDNSSTKYAQYRANKFVPQTANISFLSL